MMVAKRTIRDFVATGDPWPAVDGWAQRQGYRVRGQVDGHRIYKKGTGMLTGARMLDITKSGDAVHLEAWVAANGAARLMSLFILPREMTVESGGATGVLPRKLGRQEVNELLQGFGQEPIT